MICEYPLSVTFQIMFLIGNKSSNVSLITLAQSGMTPKVYYDFLKSARYYNASSATVFNFKKHFLRITKPDISLAQKIYDLGNTSQLQIE